MQHSTSTLDKQDVGSVVATNHHGPVTPDALLDPYQNRGAAFTEPERDALDLTGRLPAAVLSLDEQAVRAYGQLQRQPTDPWRILLATQLLGQSPVERWV